MENLVTRFYISLCKVSVNTLSYYDQQESRTSEVFPTNLDWLSDTYCNFRRMRSLIIYVLRRRVARYMANEQYLGCSWCMAVEQMRCWETFSVYLKYQGKNLECEKWVNYWVSLCLQYNSKTWSRDTTKFRTSSQKNLRWYNLLSWAIY